MNALLPSLLLLAACSDSPGEPGPSSDPLANAEAAQAPSRPPSRTMEAPRPDTPGTDFRGITDTSGLPEAYRGQEPLWELQQSATTTRRESCTRLYADGSVYTWSSTRRVLDERGLPSRVPAPPAWRLEARISDEALSEIRALLAADPLRSLQSTGGDPAPDAGRVSVRARVDGQMRAWTFTGAADEELPAPVRAVSLAIQRGVLPGAVPVEN